MNYDAKHVTTNLTLNPHTQKLFIFDLDGTIVYQGKRLTADFEKCLQEIVLAGHLIYFATGRSYRDYLPMLPNWCHELPAVTFGGGLVTHNQQHIYQQFINSQHLLEFIEVLNAHQAAFLIDSHNAYFHSLATSWILDDILAISGQSPNLDMLEVLNEGAYKLLVLDSKFMHLAEDFVAKFDWVIKYHSYHDCFDVMPSQVNKFVGISQLNLPHKDDIYVFGNDHNDLELMQNFENNILFGNCAELLPYAKVTIDYDSNLVDNFRQIIRRIIKK